MLIFITGFILGIAAIAACLAATPRNTYMYWYGDKCWYQNGNPHRDDGPAIEYADGSNQWYQNGKLHRTDGPAIEWIDGSYQWFQTGEKHREDGPAVKYSSGEIEWWLNNNELSPAEFASEILDKETAILWKMSGYCWPFEFNPLPAGTD